MEQKKTLWIIASVGAFLLLVLGIAWFNYTPKENLTTSGFTRLQKEDVSRGNGWEKQVPVPPPAPSFENAKVEDVVVVADNATVVGMNNSNTAESTTIDLNALKKELIMEQNANVEKDSSLAPVQNEVGATEQSVPVPQNINITVNVPEFNTEIKKETAGRKSDKLPSKKNFEKSENVVVKEVPAKKESKKSAPAKVVVENDSKATVKVSVDAPKPEKLITQYWVQVAAYGSKKAAEAARSVLDENRIPSDIFTYKDNKENLFYRVRVGPYTTKSEAEYWRTRINKIDEFSKAESYVTSTTKTAN